MSRKPSKKSPPKNQDKLSEQILATVSDPSFQRKVGITVGVVALGAFIVSQAVPSRRSNERATESGKDGYAGPPPLTKEEVDSLYASAIESLQRKSQEATPRGGDDGGEDSNAITPEFELFYNKIMRAAPPKQYTPEVRCTIAEFLIVHARFENIARQSPQSPPPPLSMEQASTIRQWVSFDTSYDSSPLPSIANKIDILYRVGMAQKSSADLRALHEWLASEEFPTPLTESSHTTDDNFFAIYVQHRFLLACLFGFWEEARIYAAPLDNIILPRSRMKLRQSFTQRAMSRPHAQCNFNQIVLGLDEIERRFPRALRPPVRFETWPIFLFKLRKRADVAAPGGEQEDGGKPSSENADGSGGPDGGAPAVAENGGFNSDWQFFVAGGNLGSNRGAEPIVKQMYVFGACVQFISPIQGVAGNLPITGAWNDSEMYAGMEWTFNASSAAGPDPSGGLGNPLLIKKSIELNMERVGHSSNPGIAGENEIGENELVGGSKGWVWSGMMVVDTKQGRPDMLTGQFRFETAAHNRYDVVMVVGSRD